MLRSYLRRIWATCRGRWCYYLDLGKWEICTYRGENKKTERLLINIAENASYLIGFAAGVLIEY